MICDRPPKGEHRLPGLGKRAIFEHYRPPVSIHGPPDAVLVRDASALYVRADDSFAGYDDDEVCFPAKACWPASQPERVKDRPSHGIRVVLQQVEDPSLGRALDRIVNGSPAGAGIDLLLFGIILVAVGFPRRRGDRPMAVGSHR